MWHKYNHKTNMSSAPSSPTLKTLLKTMIPSMAPPQQESGKCSQTQMVKLNIRGQQYVLKQDAFEELDIYEQIKRESPVLNVSSNCIEYFVDSEPTTLICVLEYCQTSELHLPPSICPNVFIRELKYWGLSWRSARPCCYRQLASFVKDQSSLLEFSQYLRSTHQSYLPSRGGNRGGKKQGWQDPANNETSNKYCSAASIYKGLIICMVMMTYFNLAAMSSNTFRHPMSRDEWVDYFSGDPSEQHALCAHDVTNMTTELRSFCYPKHTYYNRSFLFKRYASKDEQLNVRTRKNPHRVEHDVFNGAIEKIHNKTSSLQVDDGLNTFISENTSDRLSFTSSNQKKRNTVINHDKKEFLFNSLPKHVSRRAVNSTNYTFDDDSCDLSTDLQCRLSSTYFRCTLHNETLKRLEECAHNISEGRCEGSQCASLPKNTFAIEKWLFTIEFICLGFFMTDFFFRLVLSHAKMKFVLSISGVTQLLVIIPMWVTMYLIYSNPKYKYITSNTLYNMLVSTRVLVVVCLTSHIDACKVLLFLLKHSYKDFLTVILYVLLVCSIYGSLMYSMEPDNMESVLNGCWWSIVTLCAVGYGDYYPESLGGKVLGGICGISGLFLMAFTVPLFVHDFALFFDVYKSDELQKQMVKKQMVKRRSKKSFITRYLGGQASEPSLEDKATSRLGLESARASVSVTETKSLTNTQQNQREFHIDDVHKTNSSVVEIMPIQSGKLAYSLTRTRLAVSRQTDLNV